METIKGIALLPNRAGWEQLQRNFTGIIDFQRYVPSLSDLREEIASGRINFSHTQVVLVADNLPQGVSTVIDNRGTTASHLAQSIGNFICPPNPTVTPLPVLVLQTTPTAAADLIRSVTDYLTVTRGADAARAATSTYLNSIEASLAGVHTASARALPDYPRGKVPTTLLLMDNEETDGTALTGAPVITCTSAKGGAGKTTTSLLLAFAAAYTAHKQGRRLNVVLIELDLPTAQIAHILGVPTSHKTILDYVNMSSPTEQALAANLEDVPVSDAAGGRILPEGTLRVLHAPLDGGDERNITAQHIDEVLTLLRHDPDVDLIVVDTAPDQQRDERVAVALRSSNLILYITDDSRQSLGLIHQNVGRLVNGYGIDVDRMKIVINNSTRTVDDVTLLQDIRSVADGVAPLAVIPRSNAIHTASSAGNTGELFHALFDRNDRDVAFAYTSLVDAIGAYVPTEGQQVGEDTATDTRKRGFFRKG